MLMKLINTINMQQMIMTKKCYIVELLEVIKKRAIMKRKIVFNRFKASNQAIRKKSKSSTKTSKEEGK